jgi:two-component system, NarL family, nitrate/nitrite response regulator NarL
MSDMGRRSAMVRVRPRPGETNSEVGKGCTTGAESHSVGDPAHPATPVSIVSNSLLLREGLAALLGAHTQLRLVASFPGQPVNVAARANPAGHVVLVDNTIGHQASIDWTLGLSHLTPPALVLVLELVDDFDHILGCIEAGASGYLLQGASTQNLVDAIVDAGSQRANCPPEVTARLFHRLAASRNCTKPPPNIVATLTARELEVLHYIALDCTNQQIACHLVVELSTVKHHVHNILEKLQLRHRWAAVEVAQDNGWLTLQRPPHLT